MKKGIYNIIVISMLWPFACTEAFEPQPANNPEAIFENIWQTFDQQYAVFEERVVNWEELYDIYHPQVNSTTTEDELHEVISNLLAHLDDGHVSLTARNREVFFSNKIRELQIEDELFDLEVVIGNYLDEDYSSGTEDSYVYGKIKDMNIAYIYFDFVGDNFTVLDDFLSRYDQAKGYIIDLRHNSGGDFTHAFEALGRFTNEPLYIFQSQTKDGLGRDDFTRWHQWFLLPRGKLVDKPIAVLTDRYTISAGERAVMALDALPSVTLIGDTTNGAHGTVIGRELANGWFYSLTVQKVMLANGKSLEGIGLAPDILVKNELPFLKKGEDQVLERAITEIN